MSHSGPLKKFASVQHPHPTHVLEFHFMDECELSEGNKPSSLTNLDALPNHKDNHHFKKPIPEKNFVMDKEIIDKEKEIEEKKEKEIQNEKVIKNPESGSSLASGESSPDDKEVDEEEEETPGLPSPQESFKILKNITTRIFGDLVSFDYCINTLVDYCKYKPSSIIHLTPMTLDEMEGIGMVKWNIFRKSLSNYKNLLSEYYADLEPLTSHIDKSRMPEIFILLTSDKISFDGIQSALETENKKTVELRFERHQIPKLALFILYMPSFDVPEKIETLGEEMDVLVRLAQFEGTDD